MIHILDRPSHVPLTEQVQAIVASHGVRAVALALVQVIVRMRRHSLIGISGVPPSLRKDVGLPPQLAEPVSYLKYL